jgi:transposase
MNKLFFGIDVGTRSSSFCVLDSSKRVVRRWEGNNTHLVKELLKSEGKLKGVIEASPLAETICAKVEEAGADIEIVDSRHTKAILHGKKKTDRIDAEVLAELAVLGWYKPVYRKSGVRREQRTVLGGRAALVNVATQLKNTVRGLLKACGIVLPLGGEGTVFVSNVRKAMLTLPREVRFTIEDLLLVWLNAYERQRKSYNRVAKIAESDEVARRLMTVPGVGPATALGFASTIAAHERFKDPKQVASYIGLAPLVHQSGDTNYHGRVTKKGDKLLRWLLVEAAHSILMRVKTPFPLRTWGLALAERKGFAKASVAVARRLATLLFTLWRTERDFTLAPIAA